MDPVKRDPEDPAPRRVGRPLDPSRDAAILQAALDGLAEQGYDRLSMEEIASRARAGKGALYRRWPSKAALVADAVIAWRRGQGPAQIPDTGSLLGDIQALIDLASEIDERAEPMVGVFNGLATAASRDPELKAAMTGPVLEARTILGEVFDRAVARGEIPAERDIGLVPDVVLGLALLQRQTVGVPDRAYTTRVMRTVIYPLLTLQPFPRQGSH
jgi:AcrR family transcriptional regulator